MAWFPADANWNDLYLPPGTEEELKDLETILRDIPQPLGQDHFVSSSSQSSAPTVDGNTPDPHSLIASPTNHNTGFDNQPMMSFDSPFFSNTYQPQGMTPAPPTEQSLEQSVKPNPLLKGREPRPHRKSVQLQGNSPLRCGWKDCEYEGTFGRKAELMRHIDALHVSPHSYDCPIRGCKKVCNRQDNLLEHIRRAH
ncbi:hypothetical protein BDV39DRAFT_204921 [Aspergillus sergii]|uniref:C2H2-type domain-containing protein n=1 Tax=Aspergillus sergii TaxID=1034303 RepID=A0A5N6X439_9EURO|nr:hypothetical protein BDV39DRAFT_204921 [Aspergillus sergii]